LAKSLVIVESPAKAKTINKFLGRDFVVKASMGHVRDLPKSKLGVDEDKNFAPQYTLLPAKKKTIEELKKAAEKADNVYLAADPDREGEAICWHLYEVLKGGKRKFFRVLFNEITKKAVVAAFDHPGEIDEHKVDAQQARRILDRLVGYKISPLLWEKVRRGLSAGRVQSVALRIIVDREREIRAFKAEEYWSVVAVLTPEEAPGKPLDAASRIAFEAKLIGPVEADGKAARTEIGSDAQAREILQALGVDVAALPDLLAEGVSIRPARAANVVWRTHSVTAKEKKKNPAPPFTTSKLQQDASRRFGYPVAKTMRVAQGLYEGKEVGDRGSVGLITYMRTDSTRVSTDALNEVRAHILATYGEKALPEKPRFYRAAKDIQDAHEAIRPTFLDLPPQALKDSLSPEEWKLYSLIWNRFVASQMEPAVYDTTTVDIEAKRASGGKAYLFRATGSVMKSSGWLAVYQEPEETEAANARDQRSGSEEEPEGASAAKLPPLAEGDPLACEKLDPQQHFTQPPPRFTEATLVKELEENGIGRPSTYAAILSVIQSRDYVEKEKGKFQPTPLGELVTDLLVEHFSDIVQVQYTARMEEELDEIEEGKLPWVEALKEFNGKFKKDLQDAKKNMRDVKREEIPTDLVCEKCGKGMVKKWGRFGQFLACSGYPECKNTKEIAGEGGADSGDSENGASPVTTEVPKESCPKCGSDMVLKRGRFGPFLACSAYPDCKTTRRITVGAEGKIESKPDVPLDELCPKCGKNLALKHGRFGEYTACSDYPTCKYIKLKETGVPCPEDGGAIVERKSRRGRVFFGCANYPDCKFVLWNRPVAKECPSCRAPFLLEKTTKREGTVLFCNNEKCDFREKVAEPVLASVAKR
jgi:DNA topoisomerase-1